MRVELTREARRHLARLPAKAYDMVAATIEGPLTSDPYRSSKPLHDELVGYRSVRRGDHRIVIKISQDRDLVTIVRIQHRSDVYRPR